MRPNTAFLKSGQISVYLLIWTLFFGCHQDVSELKIKACKLAEETGSDGSSVKYTYDQIGNLLSEVSSTSTTTYTYDANYFLVSSTYTPKSRKPSTTTYEYDSSKRLRKIKYSDGGVDEYVYNGSALEIKYTSGLDYANRRYDNSGRIMSITSSSTVYEISNGQIISFVNSGNYKVFYLYDSKGQIKFESYVDYKSNTAYTREYTFDNKIAPSQTRLRDKGFPILVNYYGESVNNVLAIRVREYKSTNTNITPTSDQTIAYTYVYNSKGLPIERRDTYGSTTRYSYIDCE